jgi:hypothetical protein
MASFRHCVVAKAVLISATRLQSPSARAAKTLATICK